MKLTLLVVKLVKVTLTFGLTVFLWLCPAARSTDTCSPWGARSNGFDTVPCVAKVALDVVAVAILYIGK
jgi:hypothetical protein